MNPDYAHLYTSFIQKHVAANKSVLLIPLVRHDHWHVVEVRLDEDVIRHYSSAGHSAYLEPVNKVIDFMDHMKAGFDPNNVWKKYRYEVVPCEQQRGMLVFHTLKHFHFIQHQISNYLSNVYDVGLIVGFSFLYI